MKSQNNSKKTIKDFFKSFVWAWNGIKECFKRELNFRVHTLVTVAVLLCSWFFRVSKAEFLMLLFCIAFVLICELLNTIAEEICNLIDENYNDKIKYIKDLAAGMVLVSAIFSAAAGLIIFIPHGLQFLKGIIK